MKIEIVEMPKQVQLTLTKPELKEKINFFDKELIEKKIDNSFNKKYRQLLYIINDINSSEDATESDTDLVLYKIEDLKNKLLNQYFKHLPKEVLYRYLQKLNLLGEKLAIPEKSKGR